MSTKKNSGFSVADQLLQGKQTRAAASAAAEPAPEPTAAPLAKSNATVKAVKKNLNIAFSRDNYRYLKLIALNDDTDITKYINKLVEADRVDREKEL